MAIAFALMICAGNANAQNRNTKLRESQQLLSIGGGLECRGSKLFGSSSISYVNFEERPHLLWGAEFKLGFQGACLMPQAYIMGGAHVRFGNVRIWAAPRIGVGAIRIQQKAHNEFFTLETSQRQFTFTAGGVVGVQYQGEKIGIGVVVGYDYNIHRNLEGETDMIIDSHKEMKNPLSVGVQLSYNLQSGVMRRCGDYPWLVEAGYMVALTGESTPRAYFKIGQSIRQGARWNGEWSVMLEENYSKNYSSAGLAYEESFFAFGSKTWVRPLIGVKAGFANIPSMTTGHSVNEQEGGTGEIWATNCNMQPGVMLGCYGGINVRLFGGLEAKAAVDFSNVWGFGSHSIGFDEASNSRPSKKDVALRLGLIYSF